VTVISMVHLTGHVTEIPGCVIVNHTIQAESVTDVR